MKNVQMKHVQMKHVHRNPIEEAGKGECTMATNIIPWSDAGGWNQPQYYSTIRCADINGDGKAEILARGADGIETWAFDPENAIWIQLNEANPAWSDASGWNQAQYYSTIQCADINGDGRAEILARGADGMQAWAFDPVNKDWTRLNEANPAWNDASGWNQVQYYSTIHCADINGDGRAEILARGADGMQAWTFNSANATWTRLNEANPAWNDASGWNQSQYYSTIQCADVNGDGRAEILARGADGMQTWIFDPTNAIWTQLNHGNPAWNDASGWNQVQYYSTIQCADINGDSKAEMMARSAQGMVTVNLQLQWVWE
jgi:VCBS repeat protein